MTTDVVFLHDATERARFDHALDFTKRAHDTQVRKYTNEPYWTHPLSVARTVSFVDGRPMYAIEAALLHDVLEDTSTTVEDLAAHFSDDTVGAVRLLTDPPLSFGNRAARKADTLARLAAAPAIVKTIKLADLIDNAPSIFANDPNFAVIFAKEKVALLEVLRGGDAGLWMRANKIVRDYLSRRKQ